MTYEIPLCSQAVEQWGENHVGAGTKLSAGRYETLRRHVVHEPNTLLRKLLKPAEAICQG